MSSKLVITLDEKTTEKFLDYARHKTESEINSDCMPSGTTISISIAPPFGSFVFFEKIEIGEASVELVDG